jgi:hypothetical protein
MPLQNRVTPFGDIVAIPQRGMFTGNRGIIHDPATRTLLNRRWSGKAWIICSCEYRGVRRRVMATRSWTELFFLDEAIALAAGHRPCFFCRREAAEGFRAAWAAAHGIAKPRAAEIDATLHTERQEHGRKRIHPPQQSPAALPDGSIITFEGHAYTLANGLAFRWSESGYRPPVELERADGLLTPPSTVLALRSGYRPVLHSDLIVPGVRQRL